MNVRTEKNPSYDTKLMKEKPRHIHEVLLRRSKKKKPVRANDQGRISILKRQLQLRQPSHNDIIIYELVGKWQNTFISYPARASFVGSLSLVFFSLRSQLERNLQLIEIGKFLFIFRSARPEYIRMRCIQEKNGANTYETNVAATKKIKLKMVDDEQEKGKQLNKNFAELVNFFG